MIMENLKGTQGERICTVRKDDPVKMQTQESSNTIKNYYVTWNKSVS